MCNRHTTHFMIQNQNNTDKSDRQNMLAEHNYDINPFLCSPLHIFLTHCLFYAIMLSSEMTISQKVFLIALFRNRFQSNFSSVSLVTSTGMQ